MPPPSLSELSYEVGDVVWVSGWGSAPQRRRAVVIQLDGHDYLVEFGNRNRRWCYRNDLRPYEAIDQLADLLRCDFCGKRPADCECLKFSVTEADGTDRHITWAYGETASNDPISQLGDLVRCPDRRPLSLHEKHKRRRRGWLAKCARRRNRKR